MKLKKPSKIKEKAFKPQPLIKKKSGAKQTGKKASWKKVKLAGKLLSDEGGAGLEGLIGLEVLENYSNNLSVIKENVKREKKTKRTPNSDSENDEESKNTRKKKKKAKKVKTDSTQNSTPTVGRFVLLKPNEESLNKVDKKKKKSKNLENSDQTDMKNESSPTIDDLVGWNGLGVPEEILRVMAEKGFLEPTEIQARTLPAAILGRRDILGAAETGSGKTLAFGIPILYGILQLKKSPGKHSFRKIPKTSKAPIEEQKPVKSTATKKWKPKRNDRDNWTPPPEEINNFPTFVESVNENDNDTESNRTEKPLYALILTPTRELAVQVRDHLVTAAKYTGIKVCAIFGGLAAVKQERVLAKCPEIVVATPGRLWELLNDGNEHLSKIDDINFLVVDETDRMIEKGHFEELRKILDRLNMDPDKKAQRQHFIFSATLTLVHDLPEHLQAKQVTRKRKLQKQTAEQKLETMIEYFGISQPKVVDITTQTTGGTAERLTECRITCSFEHKDFYLYYFLQRHPGRTIVFCNSIESVRRLTQLCTILNCAPRALHAKMAQRQRLTNLERFSQNPTGLLIATDVAARGLDIPNVQHVIHYQVPRTSENYIHRSGRTARGQNEGIAVLMMEPGEIREYMKLCRTLKRSEDLPMFPIEDRYLSVVRDRVALARQLDKLELKARRTKSDIGWLKKTAKEMDILIDDQSDFSETDFYGSDNEGGVIERSKDNRILKQKREELKKLLAKPIFPKGFSFKYPTSSVNDISRSSEQAGATDVNGNNDFSKGNAIDVMKNAIIENKEAKRRRNKKVKY